MADRFTDTIYAHTESVRSVAFSHDGELLASAGNEGIAKIWDLKRLRCVFENNFGQHVRHVSFSPDSKLLAVTYDAGEFVIVQISDHKEIARGTTHKSKNIAWLDDQTIVCAGQTGRALLFNIKTSQYSNLHRHQDTLISYLAVSPDKRFIVSGDDHGVIRMWDTQSATEMPSLVGHKGFITGIAFNADSTVMGTCDRSGYSMLWNLTQPKITSFQGLKWNDHELTSTAFCPCYNIFALASNDGRVRFFDMDTSYRRLEELAGHQRAVNDITFSRDGKTLASGSQDTTIRLWNVKNPIHVA